jgi:exonuclease VII small subunit
VDLGELYAGPWQDFVSSRDRLAAAAKAAGDAAGARALKKLKKPTRGAWLVNLLARHETERLAEVFELGDSLARAHREADPVEMRKLSTLRSRLVGSLAGRASALGAERGYAAPDAVRSEVAETLQAAMADPTLAERILGGTLTATVRAAGFGPADLFAPSTAPALAHVIPLRAEEPPEPADAPPGPDPAEVRRISRELGRAEARWEAAQGRWERAEEAATAAEDGLALREQQLALAIERVAELRAALLAAERETEAALTRRDDAAAEASMASAARQEAAAEAAAFKELIDRLSQELDQWGIDP